MPKPGTLAADRKVQVERGESPELAGGAPPANDAVASAGRAAVDRIVAQVDLCVATNSTDRTSESIDDLRNQRVGHSFIRYWSQDDSRPDTTFGFYAKNDIVNENPFNSYTPGEIREPDPWAENASGWITYRMTQAQSDALLAYRDAHKSASYSLYHFNCTDFAEGAMRAAGQTPPTLGTPAVVPLPTGISNAAIAVAAEVENHVDSPVRLYSGILKDERTHQGDAHTTPLKPGETQNR